MKYGDLRKMQAGLCAVCMGHLGNEYPDFAGDGSAKALLCMPCHDAIRLVNDQFRLNASTVYLKMRKD